MKSITRKFRGTLATPSLAWLILEMILLTGLVYGMIRLFGRYNSTETPPIILYAIVLLTLVLATLVAIHLIGFFKQRNHLRERLAENERQVGQAYQRLETIFQVSQKFVEASDENEVVEPVIHLLAEMAGSDGASFVPLDEHGLPQTAISSGAVPFPGRDAWVEYLASPGVRDRCRACENMELLEKPISCPLLEGPFVGSVGAFCIPVRRGEHEFGVVTLFLSNTQIIDTRMQAYLRTLIDEMALGLESVRLRRRELDSLRQMQTLRQKSDLQALLNNMLENVHTTMEADLAMMVVLQPIGPSSRASLSVDDFPTQVQICAENALQGVITSGKPVVLDEVGDESSPIPGVRSLAAAPLLSFEHSVLGAILVGYRRAYSIHQRQLALLQIVVGQVSLLVQYSRMMDELKYETMIQERRRLAREIHDGLGQTLGFLKLQVAQMRGYFGRAEIERARQSAELCYQTLSEAYQDARQAIDGLRISPSEMGISGWLQQTVDDFQEVCGLPIDLQAVNVQTNISPEIQAQLIRILQEALSNVRKHARAGRVWVSCKEKKDNLLLEVGDDGNGFSLEDVSLASRHGLQGMRERADLIGADFQVISQPQEGTIVRLYLPLGKLRSNVSGDLGVVVR